MFDNMLMRKKNQFFKVEFYVKITFKIELILYIYLNNIQYFIFHVKFQTKKIFIEKKNNINFADDGKVKAYSN